MKLHLDVAQDAHLLRRQEKKKEEKTHNTKETDEEKYREDQRGRKGREETFLGLGVRLSIMTRKEMGKKGSV